MSDDILPTDFDKDYKTMTIPTALCLGCLPIGTHNDPTPYFSRSCPVHGILDQDGKKEFDISKIVSKDAPMTTNEKGGSQSHIPVRFDLIDGKALFAMAAVLHEGAEKYGANNWRKIDIEDHLNHLIMHAYAYLSGDRSDEHLSHIMCRAMFAQATELTEIEPDPSSETYLISFVKICSTCEYAYDVLKNTLNEQLCNQLHTGDHTLVEAIWINGRYVRADGKVHPNEV